MIKTILTSSSQFPQINPQSADNPDPEPKKSKKAVIFIIVFLFLILSGAGLVFGLRLWDPLWNPFRPSPEKVMQEMIIKMKGVETFHSEVNTVFSARDKESDGKISFNLGMKGDFDIADIISPKSSSVFDLNFKIGSGVFSMDTTANGEIKVLENNYYLKINSAPGLDQIASFVNIDPKNITGKWFRMNHKKMQEYGIQDVTEKNNTIRRIKSLLLRNDIYSFKQQLADEKLNGKDVYHYKLALDLSDEKTANILMKEIERIKKQGFIIESSEMEETFKRIGEVELDFWIGKRDFLLYKVVSEKSVDDSNSNASIKFDMNLSNINEPISVDAPDKSEDLFELILPVIEKEFMQESDNL